MSSHIINAFAVTAILSSGASVYGIDYNAAPHKGRQQEHPAFDTKSAYFEACALWDNRFEREQADKIRFISHFRGRPGGS